MIVDESGDSGLKIGEGSTSHFVVALVVFEGNNECAPIYTTDECSFKEG